MKEQLERYVEKVKRDHQQCGGIEDAAKRVLIVPLFRILGYDMDDPQECIDQFKADLGARGAGQYPVDWALFCGGDLALLVEAKAVEEDIAAAAHYRQLRNYFSQNQPHENLVGILTNGVRWLFFTDLYDDHVMDKEPFLDWDVLNGPIPCEFLSLIRRDDFNPEHIKSFARRKRRPEWIAAELPRILEPSAKFVEIAIEDIEDRDVTPAVIEEWKPILAKALREWATEQARTATHGPVGDSKPPLGPGQESPTVVPPPAEELHCRGEAGVATGIVVPEGFLVRKGSAARQRIAPASLKAVGPVQKQLLEEGVLVEEGDGKLRFTRDYTFGSSSGAAGLVLGHIAAGPLEWENKDGKALREIMRPGGSGE